MTILTSSENVDVPAPFAAAYLSEIFGRERSGGDGMPHGLMLDGRIATLVSKAAHISVNGSEGRALAITWTDPNGAPFPTFSGSLAVVNASRVGTCVLVISGTYSPRDKTGDRSVAAPTGFAIAKTTVTDILRQLRDRLLERYGIEQAAL